MLPLVGPLSKWHSFDMLRRDHENYENFTKFKVAENISISFFIVSTKWYIQFMDHYSCDFVHIQFIVRYFAKPYIDIFSSNHSTRTLQLFSCEKIQKNDNCDLFLKQHKNNCLLISRALMLTRFMLTSLCCFPGFSVF